MGLLSRGGDARLALAFTYGIHGVVRFDPALSSWPNVARDLPFFEDNGVQGIRLDSSRQRMSLYLFSGDPQSLSVMQSTLDDARWKKIRASFAPRSVHVVTSAFTVDSRRFFDTIDDYTAYAVKVQTPQDYYSAVDQGHFSMTADGFSFAALSGVEGVTNVQFELRDPAAAHRVLPLAILPPTVFVIEDMDSHVILLLGRTSPDLATLE